MTMILSILNRFKNLSKIPPHLAYVATLPCERLMSAKQAINDKLQGSVATRLWCGGVINNQIKKSLFLSHEWKKLFKSVNIWPSYKQDRDCFVHFLRLLAVCWPSAYVYQRKGFFLIVQVVPWYSWPFTVFFVSSLNDEMLEERFDSSSEMVKILCLHHLKFFLSEPMQVWPVP